ncbi:MAG: hypothetical protein ABIZ04_17820 [Opitutus sp.]
MNDVIWHRKNRELNATRTPRILTSYETNKLNPARPRFSSVCDKKSGGAFGLSPTFRKLLDEAKVEYKDVFNGKGRRFYDLGSIASGTHAYP